MFRAYADQVGILDMNEDIKHKDIFGMLNMHLEQGYKKGFASAEAYVSDSRIIPGISRRVGANG